MAILILTISNVILAVLLMAFAYKRQQAEMTVKNLEKLLSRERAEFKEKLEKSFNEKLKLEEQKENKTEKEEKTKESVKAEILEFIKTSLDFVEKGDFAEIDKNEKLAEFFEHHWESIQNNLPYFAKVIITIRSAFVVLSDENESKYNRDYYIKKIATLKKEFKNLH